MKTIKCFVVFQGILIWLGTYFISKLSFQNYYNIFLYPGRFECIITSYIGELWTSSTRLPIREYLLRNPRIHRILTKIGSLNNGLHRKKHNFRYHRISHQAININIEMPTKYVSSAENYKILSTVFFVWKHSCVVPFVVILKYQSNW